MFKVVKLNYNFYFNQKYINPNNIQLNAIEATNDMNKINLKSQSLPSLARLNLHNDSMQMMNAKLAHRLTDNVNLKITNTFFY